MVPDLQDVHVAEHLNDVREPEGVAPVLDLGISWKEQLLAAHLEQQDEAGVVHRPVERGDDLQQLAARGGRTQRGVELIRRQSRQPRRRRLEQGAPPRVDVSVVAIAAATAGGEQQGGDSG